MQKRSLGAAVKNLNLVEVAPPVDDSSADEGETTESCESDTENNATSQVEV